MQNGVQRIGTRYKRIFTSVQQFSLQEAMAKMCARSLLARRNADMRARRGGAMVLFANDFISQSVNVQGLYEWSELQTIFGFLTPLKEHFLVSTALDVGANVGNHSIFSRAIFQWSMRLSLIP